MPKLSIRDIDLANKRVFIRVDFNVPLTEDGSAITDDTRIVATLPTIVYALRHKAKVIGSASCSTRRWARQSTWLSLRTASAK